MTAEVLQCKLGSYPGFPAAPECDIMIIRSFRSTPYVSGRSGSGFWGFRPKENSGRPAGVLCHWNTCSPGVFFSLDLSYRPRIYVLSMFSDMFSVLWLQGFPGSNSIQPGALVSGQKFNSKMHWVCQQLQLKILNDCVNRHRPNFQFLC